jgi:MmpS family membrane protein
MNDPRRPEHVRSARRGADPTEQPRQPYPPYADPAYSGQSYYPPAYYPDPSPNPTETSPTEKLPQYWLQGEPPPDEHTHEGTPERPKTPRWLWLAGAAAALLLVAALVIALVIANGVAKKQTAVPLLPAIPSSQIPPPTMSTSTSTSTSSSTGPSSSATTSQPTGTGSPPPSIASAMQTVVYNVVGEGRAISITYVDNDGMMQTEFNVGLPWSKQVSLPKSGNSKANVTIVNIGHDVTCSVTVDGIQVRQHTGAGLTRCDAAS